MNESVSILIRTFNEERYIATCLDKLFRQDMIPTPEIAVIDSGSTDSTLVIASRYPVNILNYKNPPAERFNYAKSLNFAIENTKGDLLVILSAHAICVGNSWLRTITSNFSNPALAGVYGRQLPWHDAYWDEHERITKQFSNTSASYDLSNADDLKIFSNVASCIRRSAWQQHPFTLPAAEDFDWAKRVVQAGWQIKYEPAAIVFHSHNESPRKRAKRWADLEVARDTELTAKKQFTKIFRKAAGGTRKNLRSINKLNTRLTRKITFSTQEIARGLWFLYEVRGGILK